MQNKINSFHRPLLSLTAALAALVVAGCHSGMDSCCSPSSADAAKTAAMPAVAPASAPSAHAEVAAVKFPLRIKAGISAPLTDSSGNVWLPEQGFDGGDIVDRPDLEIANTKDPALYRTEHYSMTSFKQPLPNGKYVVKLHFCETFEGIEGPGQRVFSYNVEGHEYKDLDLWVKAGGPRRAYIQTVNVEVTDGKLDVTFTPNVENPQINAIEIIPAN